MASKPRVAKRFSGLRDALGAIVKNPRAFAGKAVAIGALTLAVPSSVAQTTQGYLTRPPKTNDLSHVQHFVSQVSVPDSGKEVFAHGLGIYASGKVGRASHEYNLAVIPQHFEVAIDGHRVSEGDAVIARAAFELARYNGLSLKLGFEKPVVRDRGFSDYWKMGVGLEDAKGRTVLTTTRRSGGKVDWYAVRDLKVSRDLVASFSLSDAGGRKCYGGLGTLHFENKDWVFEPELGGFYARGNSFSRPGAQAGIWVMNKDTKANLYVGASTEFGRGRSSSLFAAVRFPFGSPKAKVERRLASPQKTVPKTGKSKGASKKRVRAFRR